LDKAKILVVDDDQDLVEIICATLKGGGSAFIKAYDGVAAVEKAFMEAPDLVILDVMMPKMNGYQVCRLLKNDSSTWHIPIMMLSAKGRDKDRSYGMSAGADDYIVKPFHPDELRDKVNKLIEVSDGCGKACPIGAPARVSEVSLLGRVNVLLDKKLQETTFLQEMTKAAVSTFDEGKILKTVLQGIKDYLDYHRMLVFMTDEDGTMTELARSGYPAHEEKFPFDIDDEAAHIRLFKDKEPVVLDGPGPYAPARGALGHGPSRRLQHVYIPILSRESIRGVLFLDRKEDEPPFTEERAGLLFTMASQLGLAIDNARLYRATLQMSLTDGLTGLYNARYFYERLEVEMSRAKRYKHDLTLFMLDIDFFKRYNDTYGHLSGDEALKHVARILKENSRATDTVARYGGEEFCVILPETSPEQSTILAERIRHAVETAPLAITISIGVAALAGNEDVRVAEDLVRLADKALYRAKDEGRNKVCVWDGAT